MSFCKIIEFLFKIDRDRIIAALECSIESDDPVVRKRAAIVLSHWWILVNDRNIIILLNALDDPDLDVQLTIVEGIRERIDMMVRGNYSDNLTISPKLIDRAILATKPIILK